MDVVPLFLILSVNIITGYGGKTRKADTDAISKYFSYRTVLSASTIWYKLNSIRLIGCSQTAILQSKVQSHPSLGNRTG